MGKIQNQNQSRSHHIITFYNYSQKSLPIPKALSITILSSTLPLLLVSREGIREFTPRDFLLEFFQYHSTKAIKGESVREARQTC